MKREMKLRCSKCFGDLTSTAYGLGIFVGECENCKVDVEVMREQAYDEGLEAGKSEEISNSYDVLEELLTEADTLLGSVMPAEDKLLGIIELISTQFKLYKNSL